jgi:hypothetical protein
LAGAITLQYLEHPIEIGQGGSPRICDGGEGCPGPVGITRDDAVTGASMDDHHVDGVTDNVV